MPFENKALKFYKKALTLLSILLICLLLFCSCSDKTETNSESETVRVFIDGEEYKSALMPFRSGKNIFFPLKSVQNVIGLSDRLIVGDFLTAFVSPRQIGINDAESTNFSNPSAIIFRIPLLSREGEKYINYRYLVDIYSFGAVDLGDAIALFTPAYSDVPDTAAILNKNSKIKTFDGVEIKTSQDLEAYYADGGEKNVFVYSSKYGYFETDSSNLTLSSPYNAKNAGLTGRKSGKKYSGPIMSWDKIASYDESLRKRFDSRYKPINSLIIDGMKLTNTSLSFPVSVTYIDAATAENFDLYAKLEIPSKNDLKMVIKDEFTLNSVIDSILLYSYYYSLSGIELDMDVIDTSDEASLNFIRALSRRLESAGLSFFLSIDSSNVGDKDLKILNSISNSVNYFIVMCFEGDTSADEAEDYSGIDRLDEILGRFESYLPKEKLILGLEYYLHAEEFSNSTNGSIGRTAFRYSEFYTKTDGLVIDERKSKNGEWTYYKYRNPDSDSYFILYKDDEKALKQKINMVNSHRFSGLAIWDLESLDETILKLISDVIRP